MKKFLPIFIFLLLPSLSFAASYPASCPAEARSIIDAVGGCSTIDPGQYSSIYGKCCSVDGNSGLQSSSEPTLEKPTPGETPLYEQTLPQSSQETPTDSYSAVITIVSILFWGGVIYLVIWFVRKLKKKKDGGL